MRMSGPLILGIAGSPRRHGNSEQLLDAALAGAGQAGARVSKLVAATHDIRPCQGCNACSLTGECVLRDEMHALYSAIDEADGIIVGSPVFFATVPAVLKIVYDRMQPYWARTHVLKEPPPRRRPGGYVVVRSGGDPYGFVAAQYTTKSVFAVLGLDYIGEVKVAGVDSPSDIGRLHPEGFDLAAELGRNVAFQAAERTADGRSSDEGA
ncbi:MAG: flavodoxin family protein [Anaerosomatales bacterium]|nr:flavodoxin family protein [Anaerosomatales bacterium]